MATTKDVALRAGVSVSTVSHVLNATRFVAPERRERVLLAMRDLGYEPNAVARSLRVNRSRAIGLIISDIGNPFFTAVVRGVEDAAQAAGYIVILCNSDEDPDKEETYLRQLRSNRVDGLILAPAGVAHAYLRALVRQASPVVFIDREVPTLEVSAVVLANEPAAYAAVGHLIELGHRRIGMIIGRPEVSTTAQRRAGYERALLGARVEIDPRLVQEGGSKVEPGREAADRLLDLAERPTAIFSANNQMTIGALAAFEERGVRVPDDMAVVSFDDFAWAGFFRPPLTTVAQPTYELGRRAIEVLLRRIEDGSAPPERIELPGTLVVRDSCGAHLERSLDWQSVKRLAASSSHSTWEVPDEIGE
jgi:LacI family transcriptional regulator